MSWRDTAACLGEDSEVFYPKKGHSSVEAKTICLRCPVRIACLNEALERKEYFGIWGGMTERERRRLQRMSA